MLGPLRDRTTSWILGDLTRMLDARTRLGRAEIEWRRALREGGHEKTTLEDLALEYIASSPLDTLKTSSRFVEF
jgi:hypothetical protein